MTTERELAAFDAIDKLQNGEICRVRSNSALTVMATDRFLRFKVWNNTERS